MEATEGREEEKRAGGEEKEEGGKGGREGSSKCDCHFEQSYPLQNADRIDASLGRGRERERKEGSDGEMFAQK